MEVCFRQIYEFARTVPQKQESLTDLLCSYYATYYLMDRVRIKERLDTLDNVTKGMSGRKQRVLNNAVRKLCAEQGREGFLTGVKVGAQMMKEVLEAEEMEKRTR